MSEGGATGAADDEQRKQLEAAFMRLVDSTADSEIKDTLLFNKTKLVNNEVVSVKALQGLTTEQLMACGLSPAAAAALKEVFKAAAATQPQAAPAGASEDTIKSRMRCSAKYCAHLPGEDSIGKQAATVVDRHHLATYAHHPHDAWSCKDEVQVALHASTADRRKLTTAQVVFIDALSDFVLLRVPEDLEPPVLDAGVEAGHPYYVHGQSTQAQADATSISHGIVSATELDARSQIRGDMLSGWGDPGGGVFSVATGKLIGINVANNHELHKVVLVPSAVISYALGKVLPT